MRPIAPLSRRIFSIIIDTRIESLSTRYLLTLLALPLLLAAPLASAGDDARALSPEEVVARWRGRLDGRHFIAQVALALEIAGTREVRELRVLRDDPADAGERVLIRFSAPSTLRNVGLLYLEQRDAPNDYYLYQPDSRRVRRLPESIADEDVYGIDLEFLGFGGVPGVPVELVSATRERLGEREVYRIHERARAPNPRFDERVLWIDVESFLAYKTEHRKRGAPHMVAETHASEVSEGIVLPRRMTFRSGRDLLNEVELEVKAIDLRSPISEELFRVVALTRAGRLPGPH